MSGSRGDVRVVLRFRPQQDRELAKGGVPICQFEPSGKAVTMNGERKAAFTFDRVFNMETQQAEVYDYAAKPVVEDVLKGYNGTIFAYGQTSSGKTHTMEGPDIHSEMRGVIPRVVENIFKYIEIAPNTIEFSIKISFVEIYLERIRDLLCEGGNNLQINENREKGVYIRHATELYMQSSDELLDVISQGNKRRRTASTGMNDQSSRSHAVVLIELTQKDTERGGSKTGRLYMVDLAGSEKVSKTGADGETLEEAKNINKSLSALGLVIMNLTDGGKGGHIPYRDSKLTRILQESLGGNSRTTIIVCCSPSSYNEMESLSSLQFAKRAKKIKNKARVNVEYSAAELTKQLEAAKNEIRKLAKRLAAYEQELRVWRNGGTVAPEDRAQLLEDSEGTSSLVDDMEAFGSATMPGVSAAGSGSVGRTESDLPEEERDAFMNRESELLDLLDEKDEEIRTLERENMELAQEKVTITKLAAESFHLQQAMKVKDEQIANLQEDNDTFEMTVETLVNINVEHQTENERLKRENDAHGSTLATRSDVSKKQFQKVEAMIAALCTMKPGGRQLPATPGTESGTALDMAVAKVRGFINQLFKQQEDLANAHASSSGANDEQSAEIEVLTRMVKAEHLKAEQTEKRFKACVNEIAQYEVKVGELEAANESINLKLSNAINAMIDAEMAAAEKGEQKDVGQSELIQSLHSSHADEKAKLSKDIADLKLKLAAVKAEKNEAEEARDKWEAENQEAEAIKTKEAAKVVDLETQIAKLKDTSEEATATALASRTFKDVTNEQLRAYSAQKQQFKEKLLSRIKTLRGPSSPQKMKPLEKMIQEMAKATDIAAKHHDQISRLKLQLQLKEERVKTLQGLYASSNESLSKKTSEVHDLHIKLRSERGTGQSRGRRGSLERRAMRGGKADGAGGAAKGIRGGKGGSPHVDRSRGIKGGGMSSPAAAVQPPTEQDLEAEVFV